MPLCNKMHLKFEASIDVFSAGDGECGCIYGFSLNFHGNFELPKLPEPCIFFRCDAHAFEPPGLWRDCHTLQDRCLPAPE